MASATNSSGMRIRNEKIILTLINKEPISRADIAKKTGLTKAAVTIIAEDLIKRGILTEEISDSFVKVGRTPILLKLRRDSAYIVGVNIKRTGISVGMCGLCGDIIFEDTLPLSDPHNSVESIRHSIEKNLSVQNVPKEKIYCISVVTPGPVDTENGVILNPPNFDAWHGFGICEKLRYCTDIPVILSNVSSATTVAEKYFGAAKKSDSFMTLTADEGIGSGIMMGDNLFRGSCEIGHISVKYDGERCECGNVGCLEKYASMPKLLKGTKYKSWSECTAAGDMAIMSREAEYLSTAIVTVANIFNIDCAVLCGELTGNADSFVSLVRSKTLCKMILKKDFTILPGSIRSMTLIACAPGVHAFLS